MGTVVILAVIIFVPICVVLTLIILLQDSKGEGLSSSAFGGSGMQSVLGGHGAATFLSKLTTWIAVGFMVISLFLMRFYGETEEHLTPHEDTKKEQKAADTESPGELEEAEAKEDSKGAVTPAEEANDEAPTETPAEDSKGNATPKEETE